MPFEKPETILRGIAAATGTVSGTGDPGTVVTIYAVQEPVSRLAPTPPAGETNPFRMRTETANPLGIAATLKELQLGP